ncbi:serine hydrolase domain-containing protein [Lutimonas sp.]|uniref:serine hydrolase domain-containing protein n=1 Tax=Lutimonas sp. TaxID=1872403 RepID=UPI003D9ACC21
MNKLQLIRGVFLLALIFFNHSCNKIEPTKKKENKSITQVESKIDSLFKITVDKNQIPGAVALIKHKGKIIFHRAYGHRNKELGQEQDTMDIFRLASMTKGLTAAAILQLNEKGLLDLDDDIAKYLPEFKDLIILDSVHQDSSFSGHQTNSHITVRQLLTHSSGIGYGFQNDQYNKLVLHQDVSEGFCQDNRTSRQNTRKIASLPLMQEPGKSFIYSLSYDVLGTLIEVVSGMRYDYYIKENLLEPLHMQNSYFIIPKESREMLVQVYEPSEDGKKLLPASYSDIEYPLMESRQFYSGGADLCGTAEDYTHFIQMIMDGGIYKNTRVLSENSVKMMLSKQTEFDDGDSDQGFSTWVTNSKGAENGFMSKGSFGFGGFFDTYGWADPHLNMNAILLLQMYPNNQVDIHGKYQKLVYELIHQLK